MNKQERIQAIEKIMDKKQLESKELFISHRMSKDERVFLATAIEKAIGVDVEILEKLFVNDTTVPYPHINQAKKAISNNKEIIKIEEN